MFILAHLQDGGMVLRAGSNHLLVAEDEAAAKQEGGVRVARRLFAAVPSFGGIRRRGGQVGEGGGGGEGRG